MCVCVWERTFPAKQFRRCCCNNSSLCSWARHTHAHTAQIWDQVRNSSGSAWSFLALEALFLAVLSLLRQQPKATPPTTTLAIIPWHLLQPPPLAGWYQPSWTPSLCPLQTLEASLALASPRSNVSPPPIQPKTEQDYAGIVQSSPIQLPTTRYRQICHWHCAEYKLQSFISLCFNV